ncbi:MAG: hypothetical protein ACFB3T_15730 [Geminicoccaceae bacterium]
MLVHYAVVLFGFVIFAGDLYQLAAAIDPLWVGRCLAAILAGLLVLRATPILQPINALPNMVLAFCLWLVEMSVAVLIIGSGTLIIQAIAHGGMPGALSPLNFV